MSLLPSNCAEVHSYLRAGGFSRPSGFTLIETLSAVAMLAVLVALMLPALGFARKKANASIVTGNFRQLAVAQMAYAVDHDGAITPVYGTAGGTTSWQDSLFPYVYTAAAMEKKTLLQLKSMGRTVYDVPESSRANLNLKSIGMNWYIYTGSTQKSVMLNIVSRPSRVILLAEMEEINGDTVRPPDLAGGEGKPGAVAFRRDGGKASVMAFFDGHIELVNEDAQVYTGQKGENLWKW